MNRKQEGILGVTVLLTVHPLSFVRWLFSSCSQCLYWMISKMMYRQTWCLSIPRSYFAYHEQSKLIYQSYVFYPYLLVSFSPISVVSLQCQVPCLFILFSVALCMLMLFNSHWMNTQVVTGLALGCTDTLIPSSFVIYG